MPAAIQSLGGGRPLCRTRLPAWRMRLPPLRQAQSRPRARSEALRAAWTRRLDDAARGARWWRSSPRSPSVLRLGGLAARERAQVRRAGPHPRARPDPLLSPLARWDAVWYLRIADSGYGGSHARAAFFPLYPLLVRALAAPSAAPRPRCWSPPTWCRWPRSSGALVLLYRLVSLELGRPLARPTLLLLAVFPAALFFGAPYSESLFLLAAVGAFYAARTGHWAWAGACAGRRRGHPQRRDPAAPAAGDALVERAAALGAPRRLAGAGAARAGRLRALPRAGRGRRAALPGRPGGLVARAGRAAAGGLGRRHGGLGRAAPARLGPEGGRVLRGGGRRPVPDRRDQPDAVRARWSSP